MCLIVIDSDKVIELFYDMDNFVKEMQGYLTIPRPKTGPDGGLSISEMMTITALYHFSGMRCFKYYYLHFIKGVLSGYFPDAPSYERFVVIKHRCFPWLTMFICSLRLGRPTGTYFGDSTKLPVCHNKRAKRHKVFKGMAKSGKSSMGWFFGFKLHLIVNQFGEIVKFCLTPGNVSDNNKELLRNILKGLKGECYLDKGYLTTLFEEFLGKGIKLITPIRDNMKNQLVCIREKLNLRKRGIIETVNGMLKELLDICHTRHRKPENFLANLMGGIVAYTYLENKPMAKVNENEGKLKIVLI